MIKKADLKFSVSARFCLDGTPHTLVWLGKGVYTCQHCGEYISKVALKKETDTED